MPDAMSLYARPEELATTVPLNAKLDHILIFFTEHVAGGAIRDRAPGFANPGAWRRCWDEAGKKGR
jgi:hypothetical protein